VDKRKNIRGEKCSIGTLTLGKLASITYNFGLDLDNDADKGKSIADIRKILKLDNYIEIPVDSIDEQSARRLFRLFKGKAINVCTLLLEWFREKKLVEVTTKTTMR